MTIKDLEAFFENGWNRHDVDALMTFMADDCVFEGAAGPDVCGTRYDRLTPQCTGPGLALLAPAGDRQR